MASHFESFFDHASFAVVGDSAHKPFPVLTYRGLKGRGKKVFAVDATAKTIEGDPCYADIDALPERVDAVVIEVPREGTRDWVQKVAAAEIKELWLHMSADSPEALKLARDAGLDVRHGTCAVQYLDGAFPHNVHRLIRKILGRY